VEFVERVLRRRAYRAEWRRRAQLNAGALQRLDQELRGDTPVALPAGVPPIEQIAGDLRRLNRQRRSGPTGQSQRWLAAVEYAYDQRLMLACQVIGVAGDLEKLDGVEREAERARLEETLTEYGLRLD
jgi:hypothetical protein